ncbi:MAG: class I SAM-dependent methyltransferase [Blastocatellia bacterium]|nr:class I SAM-dependent methyltransferase [Blastocatellia bacterium]
MGKPVTTYQKLRGSYYTPKPIADFLARWAIAKPDAKVLEPSCGDGNLLEAAALALIERGANKRAVANLIHGVEIDRSEGRKATERILSLGIPALSGLIHTGDFFAYCKMHLSDKRLFDAVIGNPPFIRYQNFIEEQRAVAFELMRRAGLHPTRLTNSWVPFLVASTFLLNKQGRMAMVIPAELLQVNYAAELRYFISNYYSQVTLITFKRLVFEGIQQEVVLLLGERNAGGHTGIRTIELEGIDDLASYEHTEFSNRDLKPMDHSTEKWTQYFLDKKEIELLRELRSNPHLTIAGDVIDVDVGVVTGLNEFFVLTKQQVEELSLKPYTKPIVSRSGHLQGVVFAKTDWKANTKKQVPAFLFSPPDEPLEELPEALRAYINSGQDKEWNKGYKCRIRKRWYIVPSVWTPDAFMLRQVHGYPKIILNETEATSTDTIHRVKFRNGAKGKTIAAAFLNSLTFAFAEVIGRSYGGGVLELEPREAEELLLPLKQAYMLNLCHLNEFLLAGDVEGLLDTTDNVLLINGLGLSVKDVKMLRGIWEKLRDRRINRK